MNASKADRHLAKPVSYLSIYVKSRPMGLEQAWTRKEGFYEHKLGRDLLNSTRGRQLQLRARGCILFASGSNLLGQFSFVASGLSVPVGDLTL